MRKDYRQNFRIGTSLQKVLLPKNFKKKKN